MPVPYEGGCICGAIRYRLEAEPLALSCCHCTDCQRHSGTAFVLSMPVFKEAVKLLKGSPANYEVHLESGHVRHGAHCGNCATRLWGQPPRFEQVLVLRSGTLDDPGRFEPVAHIWVRSKQPWVVIPEGVASFETQPEDPFAIVKLWREKHARA
ncbi:MAG TPA: GFA family protein [Candidatus Binatia bacterium]|nr:GFA family protein [Candidatus Binatia bacterium]